MLAEVARQKIYYEVFGSGKRILFLHGWGGSCESFYSVAEILSPNFQTILIDLPGFGRSNLPRRTFGTFDYAEIIWGFLKELGIDKIAVAGHSFGGRIALAMVITDPTREVMERLILIDSEGVSTKNLKTKVSIAAYKATKRLSPTSWTKKLKSLTGSKDYLEAGPLQSTLIKVVNEDLKPLLTQITVPTLIIWGKDDKITPLKDARVLSKKIENSHLEILEDAGHFSYLDQPEIFCRLVKNFTHGA